jgi:hypothetical protein
MHLGDVLPIDEDSVSGTEIAYNEYAVQFGDLAVDATGPTIFQTDIGLGAATNDSGQFLKYECGGATAKFGVGQLYFHVAAG